MTTRVLLVRHAQSTWNAEGRWQGWADPPLSDLGEQQAVAASAHLPPVDAACSSDLQRARRTAELLVEGRDVAPVEVFRGLRERGVGDFTGLTRAQIADRFPGVFDRDPVEPPGAESIDAILARTVATLSRIAADHPRHTVLAVTHGGIIRTLERHVARRIPASLPNLAGVWTDVEPDGAMRLGNRVLLHEPSEAPVTTPQQL